MSKSIKSDISRMMFLADLARRDYFIVARERTSPHVETIRYVQRLTPKDMNFYSNWQQAMGTKTFPAIFFIHNKLIGSNGIHDED